MNPAGTPLRRSKPPEPPPTRGLRAWLKRATLTTEHPASSYGQPVPVAEDGGAFDAWMIADVRPVPELRERPTEDAEGRDIREFVDAATGEVVLCDEWRECQDAQ